MRRRGEYSVILEEYARFYPLGDRLAVFWYDDIKTRPVELMREILTYLRLDPKWAPLDPYSVVSSSLEDAEIAMQDALEVAAYYAPFDRKLCCCSASLHCPGRSDRVQASDSGYSVPRKETIVFLNPDPRQSPAPIN